jgi:hypothetical protein
MKNWGDGNPDISLLNLFKNSKHKDNFYTKELVPLFFETLNNIDSEKYKRARTQISISKWRII